MKLEDCIKKIERYLSSDTGETMIVNVRNAADKKAVLSHFNVKGTEILSASQICSTDGFPGIDVIYERMQTSKETLFITELTTFLKLYGEEELTRRIHDMLGMQIPGHVVVLAFQCERQLEIRDPRIARRIVCVDGDLQLLPKLEFVSEELSMGKRQIDVKGLQHFADAVEAAAKETLRIQTSRRKDSFPGSLFVIAELNKAYDVLCQRDERTRGLDENLGDATNWAFALEHMPSGGKWEDAVSVAFGNYNNLDLYLGNYSLLDENRRWFYIVALKLFGANNNWCLQEAARQTNKRNPFVRMVYRCILDVNQNAPDFWRKYVDRKHVLRALGNQQKEALDFSLWVKAKGRDALYYLTDNTRIEREAIIDVLDQYGMEYEFDELITVLQHVYPALHDYLMPYHFEQELLNQYFQSYKYQKVINKVLPEFQQLVNDQADKREFNLLLPARSSVIESINKTRSELFFVDALGVEFLSYIMKKIQDKGLRGKVTVCRSNLPSLTSCNKEFVDLFKDAQLPVTDIKDLDEIKHHGENEFDYTKTKLPIHLISELEIIDKLMDNIELKLSRGDIEKGIIMSDHGASRLAVIKEEDINIDVNSKGTHGGRICAYTDGIKKIDHAIREDDVYILASYARFRGGRAPSVETHGGATLEEVTVPIIEITRMIEEYEITLIQQVITVSFKKKAALDLFSKTPIQDPRICIRGKYYKAADNGNHMYHIDISDVKKSGKYLLDVYSGDNLIAADIPFEIQKESSKERDLFA